MRLDPDVIVADIIMPVLTGIEAAYRLHEAGCRVKFVFLTVHSEDEFVGGTRGGGGAGIRREVQGADRCDSSYQGRSQRPIPHLPIRFYMIFAISRGSPPAFGLAREYSTPVFILETRLCTPHG
jgi:hypothetical protein